MMRTATTTRNEEAMIRQGESNNWHSFANKQHVAAAISGSLFISRLCCAIWMIAKIMALIGIIQSGRFHEALPRWVTTGMVLGAGFAIAEYRKSFTIAGVLVACYPILATFPFALAEGGYQLLVFNFTYIVPPVAAMLSSSRISFLSAASITFMYLRILSLHWMEYQFPPWIADLNKFRIVQFASWAACVLFLAIAQPLYDRLRNEPMFALKKAQQKLQMSIDALVAETRLLQRDVATYSHEIRTSLNVIATMADSLTDAYSTTAVSPEALLLQTAAKSLITLSNNVLDVSAAEVNALRIESTVFDLDALIHRLVNSMQFAAGQRRCRLRLQMPSFSIPMVRGDAARMQQVLCNVLSNAVRYCGHGDVLLQVNKRAGADVHSITLQFQVIDNGAGIGADVNLFQRVRSTNSSELDGTRTMLGLYITRKLVQRMGGGLSVANRISHRGTIVCISIPFVVAEPTVLTGAEQPLSILYADDEPANLFVMRTLLRNTPHQLHTVADGAQAVELFGKLQPDLVLLDIEMPVCNGIEAMNRIRAQERSGGGKRTPIAFITAHASPEFASLDCDTVLPKPIARAALIQYIGSVVYRLAVTRQQSASGQWMSVPVSTSTDINTNVSSPRESALQMEQKRLAKEPSAEERVGLFKRRVMFWMSMVQCFVWLLGARSVFHVVVSFSYLLYPWMMGRAQWQTAMFATVQQLFSMLALVDGPFGYEAMQFCSVFPPLLLTVLNGSLVYTVASCVILCTSAWTLCTGMPMLAPFTPDKFRWFVALLTINNLTQMVLFTTYLVLSDRARANTVIVMADTTVAIEKVQQKIYHKKLAAERFAESVMYDFRSPLRIVEGVAFLLSERTMRDSGDVCHNMRVLRGACQLLLNVLENVADMQAIREHRLLSRVPTVMHMTRLFEEAVQTFEFQAHAKNVRVFFEVSEHFPAYIIGDTARATQVVLNLLRCAVRVARGGTVTLHLVTPHEAHATYGTELWTDIQKVQTNSASGDAMFQILIRVDGAHSGAVPHDIDHEPGLVVAREIVEQLGGVFSAPCGQRSSLWFAVTLCMFVATHHEPHGSTDVSNSPRALNILSINESVELQYMLRLFLQDTAHRITTVLSGQAALQAISKHRYDVILFSDVHDMDGYQLLAGVRAVVPARVAELMYQLQVHSALLDATVLMENDTPKRSVVDMLCSRS
eukprot:TRINITY_DN5285_c0_g1_i1.p1 TRINITY_DN5285_c0_g1~~TRINITY_DN5285_c0_g1_i1.p1  ORF type:complete len:1184 (+),score=256.89 TRINITY_DN5285_c0_g1_i1:42-3593(+)